MSTKILTQQGTDIIQIQNTVHPIPIQVNIPTVQADIIVAPAFNFIPCDYTVITSTVTVTVTVTVKSSNSPVLDLTELENTITYTKNTNTTIMVENDADSSVEPYEVSKITLLANQFSYTSKKDGNNLIYTYTASYEPATSAEKAGSYWYIIRLPQYHSWDLTGNDPLIQKTVAILPWEIKSKESFYEQINTLENTLIQVIALLIEDGYPIEMTNSQVYDFKDFKDHIVYLDTTLVERAEHGTNIITVDNDKNMIIGNEYVISNNIMHELVTLSGISSLYKDNDVTYSLSLKKTLQGDYNAGSIISPSYYYSSGDTATTGRTYKYLGAKGNQVGISNLSTSVRVTEDAESEATVLKVSNSSKLVKNTTYHLLETQKTDYVNYQTVTVLACSDDYVTLAGGLSSSISADDKPTFYKVEEKDCFHVVYQTWYSRSDETDTVVAVSNNTTNYYDNVTSKVILDDQKEQPNSLTSEEFNDVKNVYWTGMTVTDSRGSEAVTLDSANTTTTMYVKKYSQEGLSSVLELYPNTQYFVTTADDSSYGVITVKDFETTGNSKGQATLQSDATLAITKGGTSTTPAIKKFSGTVAKPLYIFNMIPPLTLNQCTFWYFSRPEGNTDPADSNYIRGLNSATYNILTRYGLDKRTDADKKLMENMKDRVTIYRRIVPFPLSITYRKRVINQDPITLDKNKNYSDNRLIGDYQFWEKSDILTILGEPTYGYQVEWPVSVDHMYIAKSSKSSTGKEGFERFRCQFNSDSSTFYSASAYIYGFCKHFKESPSGIILNIILSSKGVTDKNYIDASFYYSSPSEKQNHELTYNSKSGVYKLSYTEGTKAINFSNFVILQLRISYKGTDDAELVTDNIESVVMYNKRRRVNWYVDYTKNGIVFPQKTIIVQDQTNTYEENTYNELNTTGHKIYIDIKYNCQNTLLKNKADGVEYLHKDTVTKTREDSSKLPIVYTFGSDQQDILNNVDINFRLKLQPKPYSGVRLKGVFTNSMNSLVVSRSALAGSTLSYGTPNTPVAYSNATFSGYIFCQVRNPYTDELQPIGKASYSAKPQGGILIEDMLDIANEILIKDTGDNTNQTQRKTLWYTIGAGTGAQGVTGAPGITDDSNSGSSRTVISDTLSEDHPLSIIDPTDEDYMCLKFDLPDTEKQLSENAQVRVIVKDNGLDSFVKNFTDTYCDEISYTDGTDTTSKPKYRLKKKQDIVKKYTDGSPKTYMQVVSDGTQNKYPPILTCCYFGCQSSETLTEKKSDGITYYTDSTVVADATGKKVSLTYYYNVIERLKGDMAYSHYSTLGFTSGNFENLSLYKGLIENPDYITGKNHRFYKIKLDKTLIDEYAGRYLGTLSSNDITLKTITSEPATRLTNDAYEDQTVFWETNASNPNIVTIHCSFRMAPPQYQLYGKHDNIDVSFQGLKSPRVQGFINRWEM